MAHRGESSLTKTYDCLGLGIAPLDILLQINKYPNPGAKIDSDLITVQGGGPIPTAMVTLARLGFKAALIGAIGDDLPGKLVIEELKREKVDTSQILIKKRATALACGWIEKKNGRRTIVLHRDIFVNPANINLKKLGKPKIIHLDGRDLSACMKLARWGRNHHIPIVFDIGSMRNDISPILPLVDHLVVSADFALPYTKTKKPLDAIRKLSRVTPGTIVVTSGTKGSLGYDRNDGLASAPAFKVNTIDTTGAGDVYHGAYIAGLLKSWPLERRMIFASACAALKCTMPGGRSGIPSFRKAQNFLAGDREIYD
jgi:sulfofructose kinase